MKQSQITSAELWGKLATLDTADVTSFFIEQCAKRQIPIPNPNPTLADIHTAIATHLRSHGSLRIVDYPGGEHEWSHALSGLTVLESAIEKVIAEKTRIRSNPPSAPSPRPETLRADPASASATACAGACGSASAIASAGACPPRDPRSSAHSEAHNGPSQPANQPRPATASKPKSTQPSDEEVAQARAEYLAGLLRERTSRSPLNDLPAERQKILFELLEANPATLVHEMLSQPEPLGWGLQTSADSLRRFQKRQSKQIQQAELAAAAAEAAKLAADPTSSADYFAAATERVVQMRLFQRATDPTVPMREIYDLSRALDRHRRASFIERKLEQSKPTQQP
jgi:hypothetical protein